MIGAETGTERARALGDVLYDRERKKKGKKRRAAAADHRSSYLIAPSRLVPSQAYASSLTVFLASLLIYYLTAAPLVSGGDSGELAISAHQWSTAHPPGYPLFTIIGHFFDIGLSATGFAGRSAAWRIAMLSVLSDAGAAALLCLAVAFWTDASWTGIVSGGLFAFSKQVWLYATQVEVFPLNNLFIAAVLLLLVMISRKYEMDRSPSLVLPLVYQDSLFQGLFAIAAFVGGLSFANQHTSVVFIVPMLLWALSSSALSLRCAESAGKSWSDVKRLMIVIGCGMAVVGFLTMASLYILMAARHVNVSGTKAFMWGDLSSVGGFLQHFLRREYGTLSLYSGTGDAPTLREKVLVYLWSMQKDTLFLGAPLGLAGVFAMTARGWTWKSGFRGILSEASRRFGIALLAALLLYVIGFFYLCNLPIHKPLFLGVFERFFPQANIIVLFFIGVGLAFIKHKLAPHYNSKLLFVVAIGLVAVQVQVNYAAMDQSDNVYIHNYAEQVLERLPPDSLLLVKGDLLTNPLMYLQLCEGFRPDVTILSLEEMTYEWYKTSQAPLYPEVVFPGNRYHPYTKGSYSMHDFLQANYHRFPIFNAGGWKPGDHTVYYQFDTIPFGLTKKVVAKEENWSLEEAKLLMDAGLPRSINLAPLGKYGEDTWEYVTVSDYWHTHHMRAHYKLNFIIDNADALSPAVIRDTAAEVVNEYESILEQCELTRDYIYLNLGIAYDTLRKYYSMEVGKEMANRMLTNWRKFLEVATPSNPSYRQVKTNVKAWDDFLEAEKVHEAARMKSYEN